jgi:hypothetical protein
MTAHGTLSSGMNQEDRLRRMLEDAQRRPEIREHDQGECERCWETVWHPSQRGMVRQLPYCGLERVWHLDCWHAKIAEAQRTPVFAPLS